ncbi:putative Vacuolar protein sorting-associated protein 4A [Blattamonas nauphoetae]|uniref:Vacuolar protein sorting-associated protein 4A n=1 Tax=Blattamonas nauphoetae TaxID=2049346 RepID=A0ABQ9XM74_9EUKA|nr:putative Vacuolar protein sorting-associated protein 4A [Blattamonas nauphoetae]
MTVKESFYRFFFAGDADYKRGMDYDSIGDFNSAITRYMQGLFNLNNAFHSKLTDADLDNELERTIKTIKEEMKNAVQRVNTLISCDPQLYDKVFPGNGTDTERRKRLVYPLPPPTTIPELPPLPKQQASSFSWRTDDDVVANTIALALGQKPQSSSVAFPNHSPKNSNPQLSQTQSKRIAPGPPPARNAPAGQASTATTTEITGSGMELVNNLIASFPPEKQQIARQKVNALDKKLCEAIASEMVVGGKGISFDDVVGADLVKRLLSEMVLYPMKRPDLFTGIRAPPKGLLLFGPPGTGKTLICKALAAQAQCRFFSLSASALTSKWVGEGEKLVKTLFGLAGALQPSIVFVDEIDSLLSERSSEENEASRRMKTEFLVQLDGIGSGADDRVVFIGATNRPFDLDKALLRRTVCLPLSSSASFSHAVCISPFPTRRAASNC